jgi:hypothetical protein
VPPVTNVWVPAIGGYIHNYAARSTFTATRQHIEPFLGDTGSASNVVDSEQHLPTSSSASNVVTSASESDEVVEAGCVFG